MSTTRYCQAGHRFDIDGTMAVGETITVTVTPAQDYQFVSWSDGNTENPRTILINECGVTYTARFTPVGPTPPEPDTYTITVNVTPQGGGTTSGGGSYTSGTDVTISVTPNNGYQFGEWTDGSQNNPRSVTVNQSDATYTARLKVYVETKSNNNAYGTTNIQSANATSGYFYPGQSVTVTATPNNGYHLLNWTLNGSAVSINQSYTFNVGNAPATYQANFEQDTQTTTCYWLSDDNDYDNLKKDVTVYYHTVSQSGNTVTIVPGAEGSSTSFGWFTAVVIPTDCTITTAFWTDGLGGVNNLTFAQRTDAGLNIPTGYKCMVASARGTTAGYQNGATKTKIVITR